MSLLKLFRKNEKHTDKKNKKRWNKSKKKENLFNIFSLVQMDTVI